MSPRACAAAVSGNSGANASPVIDVRGPSSTAARTRARASDTSIRSTSDNKPAVPFTNNRAATERTSSSTMISRWSSAASCRRSRSVNRARSSSASSDNPSNGASEQRGQIHAEQPPVIRTYVRW